MIINFLRNTKLGMFLLRSKRFRMYYVSKYLEHKEKQRIVIVDEYIFKELGEEKIRECLKNIKDRNVNFFYVEGRKAIIL